MSHHEYCGDCDGTGWVEGGPTIVTTCAHCGGLGWEPSKPDAGGATVVALTPQAEALVQAGLAEFVLHIEVAGGKTSEGDGVTARDLELQQLYHCEAVPCPARAEHEGDEEAVKHGPE